MIGDAYRMTGNAHRMTGEAHRMTGAAHRMTEPVNRGTATLIAATKPRTYGAGPDLDRFLSNLRKLEDAAASDGYTFSQRVSALRKIFYDGPGWDRIIASAAATRPPPSWAASPQLRAVRAELDAAKPVAIGGGAVDLGHVLAGLDARLHRGEVDISRMGLSLTRIADNHAAATYAGDLGSVVSHFIETSRLPVGRLLEGWPPGLESAVGESASGEDLRGDIDSYLIALDQEAGLVVSVGRYYAAARQLRRWSSFARLQGLDGGAPGTVIARTSVISRDVLGMAVALTGRRSRGRALEFFAGISVGVPDESGLVVWKAYHHISQQVARYFVALLQARAAAGQ
ncbi:MAG: hypothetical protein IT370_23850 [Deltaproteobacteria bacterium]|nr:hypothetical protein [Deltaproteobacteria bacterium]